MLEVSNLSKAYGKNKALKDMTFKVKAGEIVALIGKNGAGKSTLLKSIAGDIVPDQGEIKYKGIDLLKDNYLLNEFGILIQASFFDYLNAFDNLVLLMKASGYTNLKEIKNKVSEVLDLVGLSEKKYSYVKSFSFGMKQRLGLAQSLLHDPHFLILDEPFVGLDPIGKEILKKVIINKARKDKAGIIFSSHDLYDVNEICDRVVMIEKGEKVFDDVFVFNTIYNIQFKEELSEQDKEELIKFFGNNIKVNKNAIEFTDKTILNEVLSFINNNNIAIDDIKTRENTLYDFFKCEVQIYGNTNN